VRSKKERFEEKKDCSMCSETYIDITEIIKQFADWNSHQRERREEDQKERVVSTSVPAHGSIFCQKACPAKRRDGEERDATPKEGKKGGQRIPGMRRICGT